jgi:hypothetical protein
MHLSESDLVSIDGQIEFELKVFHGGQMSSHPEVLEGKYFEKKK